MSHLVVHGKRLNEQKWNLPTVPWKRWGRFKGHPDMLLLARLLMGHPQGMAQLVHDHARILAIWVWPKVADPYCGTVGGFLAEAQEILQIMLRQFAMVHGRTVCIVGTAGF